RGRGTPADSDWMNSFQADTPAATESPDWMSGIGATTPDASDLPLPDFGSPYEASTPVENFSAPEESDTPDWMRDMPLGGTPSTPTPDDFSTADVSSGADQGDVPDWLRNMAPSNPTPSAPAEIQPTVDSAPGAEPNWAFEAPAEAADLGNADWLNAVSEESTSAPVSDFAPGAPTPAAEPDKGFSPFNSKDIDALLNLAPLSTPPAAE